MSPEKKITVTKLPKAYRGSFSTFMVTIIIIAVGFFLPMITANEVEKSRNGEGRYTPMEEMLWDLKAKSDFKSVTYTMDENELGDSLPSDTYTFDEAGQSNSIYWVYHGERTVPSTDYANCVDSQVKNIIEFEITDPVVDEYGSLTLIAGMTDDDNPYLHDTGFESEYNAEQLIIHLEQDSTTWVEQDATRLEIFLKFETSDIPNPILTVEWVTGSNDAEYTLSSEDDWINGEIYSVDITVEDLIAISSIKGTKEYLRITLTSDETEGFPAMDEGDLIIYDVQVYGLDSSVPSLTIISVWYIIQAVIIFFMGFVMLPTINIGGMFEYLTNITKA